MGELRRDLTLADLARMGFDIKSLRRTKREARIAFQKDSEERDPNTIPLIRPDVASRVADNFSFPNTELQGKSSSESATASMFIRMNADMYFSLAQRSASDEMVHYANSVRSGFLHHLNTWLNDGKNFAPQPEIRASAFVGSAIMLQMLRVQLGYEYSTKLDKSQQGYDVPEDIVSGGEWMKAFSSIFPFGTDRHNPIQRVQLPTVPLEQTALHDVLDKASLVVPDPFSLRDGASGVYNVLEKNWAKLKLR